MEKQTKKANAEQQAPAKTQLIGTESIIEFAMDPSLNIITHKHLTKAEKLFLSIGIGKKHAVKINNRDANDRVSRAFRALVSEANAAGYVIINDGDGEGYYRPDLSDPAEYAAYVRYTASLQHRVEALQRVLEGMAKAIQ